jgi:hypothetical protein
MQDFEDAWKARIAGALNQALREAGLEGMVGNFCTSGKLETKG